MTRTDKPSDPMPNEEKSKPQRVRDGAEPKGREERDMEDVPRGSEGDRRRAAQNRS